MTQNDTERRVQLTCFNCSEQWCRTLERGERIGEYSRLSDGGLHDGDVVCTNTRGYGTYAPEICPVCGMEGPHEIRSEDNPTFIKLEGEMISKGPDFRDLL